VTETCGRARQILLAAEIMAKNRPSTIVWCMGQTQHAIGNAIVRALHSQLVRKFGVSGGGTSIFAATITWGRDRRRTESRLPARLLRHCAGIVVALGRMSGTSTWISSSALHRSVDDQARHNGQSLDRCGARAERCDRAGAEPAGRVPWGHANSQRAGSK
jgi:anaerobic selenocysteine-containing dehydrogenase